MDDDDGDSTDAELIADSLEMLAAFSAIQDRSIRRQVIALAVALRPERPAKVVELFPQPKRRTWPPLL